MHICACIHKVLFPKHTCLWTCILLSKHLSGFSSTTTRKKMASKHSQEETYPDNWSPSIQGNLCKCQPLSVPKSNSVSGRPILQLQGKGTTVESNWTKARILSFPASQKVCLPVIKMTASQTSVDKLGMTTAKHSKERTNATWHKKTKYQ